MKSNLNYHRGNKQFNNFKNKFNKKPKSYNRFNNLAPILMKNWQLRANSNKS